MDTPTQALLGATVGQACFGHKLGRRAAWWGALGGLIPDLDVVMILPYGRLGEFLWHRGPTHSLWFGPIVGPVLGFVVWKYYQRKADRSNDELPSTPSTTPRDQSLLWAWVGLFVLALFTHPLLDLFTTYGTQLFSPFSNHRFALNGVAIIDPAYSILLIIALIIGSRNKTRPKIATSAAAIALILSTLFLFYALSLNKKAEREATRQLETQGIENAALRSYPVLLQPYLRRIVARTPDEVYVGYISMWRPTEIDWDKFFVETHPLVAKLENTREGKIFRWFAMEEVAVTVTTKNNSTVVEMDDIRYGLPGKAKHGIWGIRGTFDAQGNLMGDVAYFDRPRPSNIGELFSQLWTATFTPEMSPF